MPSSEPPKASGPDPVPDLSKTICNKKDGSRAVLLIAHEWIKGWNNNNCRVPHLCRAVVARPRWEEIASIPAIVQLELLFLTLSMRWIPHNNYVRANPLLATFHWWDEPTGSEYEME